MSERVERPGRASTWTDSSWILWGAVRSGLAALDHDLDGLGASRAPAGSPSMPARIEQYLAAALECGTLRPDDAVLPEAIAAVRSACAHLREQETTDAYLALLTARTGLDTVMLGVRPDDGASRH